MAAKSKIDVGDVVVWCMNRELMNYNQNFSPDESAWGIGIIASLNRLAHMNPYEVWTIHSYLMEFGHMNYGFFKEEDLTVISKQDFWMTGRSTCAREWPE